MAATRKTTASAASKTLADLASRKGTVFTRLGAVKFAVPVYGTVFSKGATVEVVLTAEVNDEGIVVAKRLKERTPEVRAAYTLPADTEVEAVQDFAVLPEGTVGARICRMAERHVEGSEWRKATDVLTLTAEGYLYSYVRPDTRTTNFCVVCERKHNKEAALRSAAKKGQADTAALKQAEEAEAQERLAAAGVEAPKKARAKATPKTVAGKASTVKATVAKQTANAAA
jgi:hypothetical protein